ncbi:hypothetical protein F5B20DRAFT_582816 [Whalleya microplaca]|nr:hypothetical protein F5B20DRAFT_582816 [Whalleya microplaca]
MTSLFAAPAFAGIDGRMEGMLDAPGARGLETRLDDMADHIVERRQTQDQQAAASQLNMTTWNADTSAACMQVLSQLTAASNPSGTAICYNLPTLDTNAGTFMADLRLFQISAPSGEFAGIPPADISVGLSYNGASVSPVSQQLNARGFADSLVRRQSSTPSLLQTYLFVGQIDKAQMNQPMTMGVLEALVMPTVTLTGKNVGGQPATTNVSSNEAAFVNGVFSSEVVMSDFALASLAVENVTAQLKSGEVAFVLPGAQIMIFPIGLIITSIWLGIGVAFYGFGTYERYRFRDSYRSRKARTNGTPYSARI